MMLEMMFGADRTSNWTGNLLECPNETGNLLEVQIKPVI